MNNYIILEKELLNEYEKILKITQETIYKIHPDLRIRIKNLYQADDLNLNTDIHEIIERRRFLINFIRVEYKINIPSVYNFKNYHSKTLKENILNQVKYGQQALTLLHLLTKDYNIDPYEYFEGLIKERFIFINKLDIYESEKFLTVSEFKKKLQHENKQLFHLYYENIYNVKREPYSREFIKMCINQSGKKESFGSQYTLLGNLRMKLVTYLVDRTCVDTRDGTVKKEPRGRKKSIK